jgi:hypothetical protein
MDQLGHQFSCNRCGARFYLDASGALVVGDRARLERGGGSLWSPVSYQHRESNHLERLVDGWGQYTGPGTIVLGVAALVGLIGLGLWMGSGPKPPVTLEGRAKYAAEAFVQEARGRLQGIATSGSTREVGAWLNLVRPHFKPKDSRDVRIAIAAPQKHGRMATVLAHLGSAGAAGADATGPGPPPASGPAAEAQSPPNPASGGIGPKIAAGGRAIELRMFWQRDPRGEWRLDGAKTFQSAVRSRFWVTSEGGPEPSPAEGRPPRAAPLSRSRGSRDARTVAPDRAGNRPRGRRAPGNR